MKARLKLPGSRPVLVEQKHVSISVLEFVNMKRTPNRERQECSRNMTREKNVCVHKYIHIYMEPDRYSPIMFLIHYYSSPQSPLARAFYM